MNKAVRIRRRLLNATAVSVLLLVGQVVPARAAGLSDSRASSPTRTSQQPSSVTSKPAVGRQDAPAQQSISVPVSPQTCGERQPRPVTLPDGRKGTVTAGCAQIDSSRLGQTANATSDHSRSKSPVPGATTSLVPGYEPPPICPAELTLLLRYDRFDLCTFVPVSFPMEFRNPDGTSFTVTIHANVEMWGLLSDEARSWTVDVVVTPTEFTGLPEGLAFNMHASLSCTDPSCVVVSPLPADGDMGVALPDVTLAAQFAVSDAASSATVYLNNVLALWYTPADPSWQDICPPRGPEPCLGPSRISFGPADPIRCDSVFQRQGLERGCVVAAYAPTWSVSEFVYPLMDLVVKHMAMASGNLAGRPGLPGDPGWTTPFTFIGGETQSQQAKDNRAAACGGLSAPPAEVARGNTYCDEYPLASTAQGAASGDPYSICWVPEKANDSQGGNYRYFLNVNRVLIGDRFYLHPFYFGSTPGCDDNLGGGGSIAPDNKLNGMFNSYGDNAGCANWSGGDATNSVVLPSGNRAWFFSDTYLNSPAERKGLWYASTLHNSIVLQDSNGIRKTITGGNTCQETNQFKSFWDRYAITPAAASDWGGFFWTGDQMVVGSNVVKFYYHGHPITLPGGGGSFTIDYSAVAAIPISSLENDTVVTVSPASLACGGSGITWGTALLNWGNAVYIYGWRSTGTGGNRIYLARSSAGDLTNPGAWRLYTGMSGSNPTWSSCGSSAAPLPITNGTTGFSVASVNNMLWLVQFDYTNGQLGAAGAIGAHPATTPWAFGNSTVPLYSPPTGYVAYPYYYQDYEARIQPALGAAGQVVISYNVNTSSVDTGCISANAHDSRIYRPRFIDVPVSAFNASAAVPAPGTQAVAVATTETTTAGPASPLSGRGILHSGPPFPIDRPLAQPASATRSALTAELAVASGIDGVTDWYHLPLGGSCPHINGPSTAPSTAVDSSGIVTATWENVGTDVWYYPWICDQTLHDCSTQGTSFPWYGAWPTPGGNLWTTTPSGYLDPIDLTSSTGVSTNGHMFAIYIQSFGAGNANGGGNSPVAVLTVTR